LGPPQLWGARDVEKGSASQRANATYRISRRARLAMIRPASAMRRFLNSWQQREECRTISLFIRLSILGVAQRGCQACQFCTHSGIVFFPGSEPLYINARLVGGLGVSGDGVDQDDYVTAGGAAGFEPPESIRADQFVINGVRLPYIPRETHAVAAHRFGPRSPH